MNHILVILFLILTNGLFSMFEIAFVSSRKTRLEEIAKKGSKAARTALTQREKPERFLSVIQLGMTLISIVAGAYGGVAIAHQFAYLLPDTGWWSVYAESVSIVIIIGIITYLTLVIGELVPKNIALNNPEKICIALTPLMRVIAGILYPVVWVLSVSTKIILKIFRIKKNSDAPYTEEELKMLIKKGSEHGVLEEQESDIIHDVMNFADETAYTMLTPNKDVVWIDINDTDKEIMDVVMSSPFSRFPVCNETIDEVLGIVYMKDIFKQVISNEKLDMKAIMTEPFFIPETTRAMKLMDDFKKKKVKMGVVVNEYGETHGIITIQDISDNVLGDFPDTTQDHQPHMTKREDGSILIDGDFQFDEVMEYLEIEVPDDFKEIKQNVSTVGGFIMYMLDKVPDEGDHIHFEHYRFEVLDMDGNRVDKILISVSEEDKVSDVKE